MGYGPGGTPGQPTCFPTMIHANANAGSRIRRRAAPAMPPQCASSALNCSRFGLTWTADHLLEIGVCRPGDSGNLEKLPPARCGRLGFLMTSREAGLDGFPGSRRPKDPPGQNPCPVPGHFVEDVMGLNNQAGWGTRVKIVRCRESCRGAPTANPS